jgi:hypothetical protein
MYKSTNSMQSRVNLRLGSSRHISTATWRTYLHCLQEQQVAGLLARAAAAALSAACSGIQAGRRLAVQMAAALLAPAWKFHHTWGAWAHDDMVSTAMCARQLLPHQSKRLRGFALCTRQDFPCRRLICWLALPTSRKLGSAIRMRGAAPAAAAAASSPDVLPAAACLRVTKYWF